MKDSQRAAEVAQAVGIPVGLHLNLIETFTGPWVPEEMRIAHSRVQQFLRRSKYSCVLYNPFIRKHFASVFRAQWDEFLRLFGTPPTHVDGHHHLHLCTNLLLDRILPENCKVRRSFSFFPGEKSVINRWYRSLVDSSIVRYHRSTDYFFDLSALRLQPASSRVTALARETVVEVMTHPERDDDFRFLLSEECGAQLEGAALGSYALL